MEDEYCCYNCSYVDSDTGEDYGPNGPYWEPE